VLVASAGGSETLHLDGGGLSLWLAMRAILDLFSQLKGGGYDDTFFGVRHSVCDWRRSN
jgi:hypothetical protein